MKTYLGKSLKKMASKDDGIFLASIAKWSPFHKLIGVPQTLNNPKGGIRYEKPQA